MSEQPREDLLESIINKSMTEQESAGGAARSPEPEQETPPAGEAPSPASGKGKKPSPPGKPTSVYRYLLVLFGAAFILLLLAYFIQQRNNETAISGLRNSMNLSRAELMEEIDELKEEKAALEEQVADLSPLTDELKDLRKEYATLEERLQRTEDSLSETAARGSILTSFAIVEQALRNRNYELAAQHVRRLAQEDLDLGIVDLELDSTGGFDAEGRLTEIIALLENRGALEPGEVSLTGQEQPEAEQQG